MNKSNLLRPEEDANNTQVLTIYDENANPVDKIGLNRQKFNRVRVPLLKQVIHMYETNKRSGNASTKTRGEVAGGGRKPWAQKHLGRARAGSIRSPLWKGGGTIFGPKPRDYSYSIPKKARRVALNSALTSKFNDNEVIVIDKLEFDMPSTKKMANILKNIKIKGSCLIIIPERNPSIWKSARNIYSVMVKSVAELNAYDVIRQKNLLITKEAMISLNSD